MVSPVFFIIVCDRCKPEQWQRCFGYYSWAFVYKYSSVVPNCVIHLSGSRNVFRTLLVCSHKIKSASIGYLPATGDISLAWDFLRITDNWLMSNLCKISASFSLEPHRSKVKDSCWLISQFILWF